MVLYFVIPCYNEIDILPTTSVALISKLSSLIEKGSVSSESRILFVDDGSKDGTWDCIKSLKDKSGLVAGLKLSRNRGHQNALLAGLMTAREYADVTISMDADLQDDIESVDEFLENYNNGCDIVYGIRTNRKKDSCFKRVTATKYYKLLNRIGVEVIMNHADCRLMSKRALDALSDFKEVNLYLRGLVPMIGFKTAEVQYERKARSAGESKYSIKKMIDLAWQGITSMSVKPIRLILSLGIILFILGLACTIAFAIVYASDHPEWQWTIILSSVWAACGLIMSGIGVIGEYIGKIYLETKSRPRFIIDEFFK